MNQKRNTIIAIIFTIIVIGVFIFASIYSINKTPTRAEKINEQLRKENASWVAKDYPQEIMEIPVTQTIDDLEIEQLGNPPIFNQETKNQFFPENATFTKNNNKSKYTGFLFLSTMIPKNQRLQDKLSWKEYIRNFQSQESCGGCSAFATIGALEAYFNKTQNLNLNLSEQYLISYSNFQGCAGADAEYYLKLITLNNYNSNIETIDGYLKQKIKNEILNETGLLNTFTPWGVKKLQTKTQLSLMAGEVPFGVPLENEIKYLAYDSCEITNNNSAKKSGMNLDLLYQIYNYNYNIFDENFCPDNSDNTNLVFPKKKDDTTKYFIENYFVIDNSDCKKENSQTIINIKDALKYTPVIANTNKFYESIRNYKEGVWEKLTDENYSIEIINNKKYILTHEIIIVGWGIDTITGKEYWILKNSWGGDWGDGGYFNIWINDKDLTVECSSLYGFSGNLIKKSGKEINSWLPIAKKEIEEEKKAAEIRRQEFEKRRQEELQKQYENRNQQPIPNFPNDLNPLNDYFQKNISYSNIESMINSDCLTITNCI